MVTLVVGFFSSLYTLGWIPHGSGLSACSVPSSLLTPHRLWRFSGRLDCLVCPRGLPENS